jgi:hypothetical protein
MNNRGNIPLFERKTRYPDTSVMIHEEMYRVNSLYSTTKKRVLWKEKQERSSGHPALLRLDQPEPIERKKI